MECPNCRKTDSRVLDSRPSKDGIAIRRRRQCLICSSKFTTYEAAQEQLLPLLIRDKVERGSPVTNLKAMLSFVPNALKMLSRETISIIDKIQKHEKAHAVKESNRRAHARKLAKRKAELLMMIETVFKIIKRHKRGVDISRLKHKTGFDAERIHKIVFELRKQGRIKSIRRGLYLKT